jgi:hypothetical protein
VLIPHRNLRFMFSFLCAGITVFLSWLKYSLWRVAVLLNWRMIMNGELGSKWSCLFLKGYLSIFMEGLLKTKKELKDSHLQSKNWTRDLLSMKQKFLSLAYGVCLHCCMMGRCASLPVPLTHWLTKFEHFVRIQEWKYQFQETGTKTWRNLFNK